MLNVNYDKTCNPVSTYCNRDSSVSVLSGVPFPVGAEVFVKIDVSWDVAARSLVETYRLYGSAD
jgi:hypothetical protein